MENNMTQYLVIVHVFVDFYKNRVFAGSLRYIIDCKNGQDLLDSLDRLENKAIEDFCGGDVDRKDTHRAGIHQVMML